MPNVMVSAKPGPTKTTHNIAMANKFAIKDFFLISSSFSRKIKQHQIDRLYSPPLPFFDFDEKHSIWPFSANVDVLPKATGVECQESGARRCCSNATRTTAPLPLPGLLKINCPLLSSTNILQ